jgi:soluble P-type ATPase
MDKEAAMLEIAIPGADTLRLDYLIADFNGTLAADGVLLPGVADALWRLAESLDLHVVTADTFGKAREALAGLPCELAILPEGGQDVAKRRHLESLGAARCVALGNGRNDRLMLAAAGLGIAVIEAEGVAVETLLEARVAAPGIEAALGLLLNPARLIATLRI